LLLEVEKGYFGHSRGGEYPMLSAVVQTKLSQRNPLQYSRRGILIRTIMEITMKYFALIIALSLGVSLAARAQQDQGPVEKTGQTVGKAAKKTGQTIEHGAQATGRTVEHGAQATERTVGKGLKNTGNTLEKAGQGTTASSKHHAKTKRSTAKPSPSPSPKPESSPVATPSPAATETAPAPSPTPGT
jgi:hypothetical protein